MNEDPQRSNRNWIPLDDKVVRLVKSDAEEHPRWPDKQNHWGLALLSAGRVGEAIEAFDRCLEINPRYAWASLNRIQALALAGDFPGARRALSDVERVQPAARTLVAAFVDFLEGHLEAAVERLDSAGEEISGRADVRRLQAAFLRTRDTDAAESAWAQLRAELPAVDPSLAAPWDDSGSVAARSASFVPGLHQLWYEASSLLGRMGRVEESERAASIALLLWADRGLYLNQRALLASFRGDDATSVRLYTEASQVAVTDPRPHVALAYHWSAQGDLERALAAATAALERAPRYPDLHYQMGLLLRANGQTKDALISFRRALEINLRYTTARLAEAGALFALEQWSEAYDAYNKVLATGLVSSDIHVYLGQIEEQLGNPERAQKAYQEATRLNPDDAEAHYRTGDLHRRRGNREAASNAWRMFLKLSRDPDRVAEVEGLLKSA